MINHTNLQLMQKFQSFNFDQGHITKKGQITKKHNEVNDSSAQLSLTNNFSGERQYFSLRDSMRQALNHLIMSRYKNC